MSAWQDFREKCRKSSLCSAYIEWHEPEALCRTNPIEHSKNSHKWGAKTRKLKKHERRRHLFVHLYKCKLRWTVHSTIIVWDLCQRANTDEKCEDVYPYRFVRYKNKSLVSGIRLSLVSAQESEELMECALYYTSTVQNMLKETDAAMEHLEQWNIWSRAEEHWSADRKVLD